MKNHIIEQIKKDYDEQIDRLRAYEESLFPENFPSAAQYYNKIDDIDKEIFRLIVKRDSKIDKEAKRHNAPEIVEGCECNGTEPTACAYCREMAQSAEIIF